MPMPMPLLLFLLTSNFHESTLHCTNIYSSRPCAYQPCCLSYGIRDDHMLGQNSFLSCIISILLVMLPLLAFCLHNASAFLISSRIYPYPWLQMPPIHALILYTTPLLSTSISHYPELHFFSQQIR